MVIKYKVGWKTKDGSWRYVMINNKADMIEEVADKTIISDKVSIKKVIDVNLIKEILEK